MVEVDRDYIFLTLDHESFLIDQVDDTKKSSLQKVFVSL